MLKSRKIGRLVLVVVVSLVLAVGGIIIGTNTFVYKSGITLAKVSNKTITVGAEAGGPYTEFYKEKSKEFTKKTGIQVQFIEVPHENMHERFITEAMAGSGAIDIYQADQPWISEFASKNFLEPLTKRIDRNTINDYLPAALETVKYKNTTYALPYLVHTPILYYRADLFKKAGLKSPPKDWTEFRKYAKLLTNTKEGIYGTVIEGKQHPEPVTHFLDRILQFGGNILDKKGNVIFNSQGVVNTLKFMLALQYEDKSSPPGAVGYDCTDVHTLFLQGKVAMAINWPYMYSMAKDPNQSKVVGKFDVAMQPGKTSAIWSWGYAIASSSKKKDLAWEFIKWAISPDVLKDLGKKFVNPVPRKSVINAIKNDKNITPSDKKAISVMSESVARGVCVANFPQFPAVQDILSKSVSKVMSRQTTPEKEVKAADSQIKQIMRK